MDDTQGSTFDKEESGYFSRKYLKTDRPECTKMVPKLDCMKCGNEVKDNQDIIQCEALCESQYHASCMKISASKHKKLKEIKDIVKWVCPQCQKTFKEIRKSTEAITAIENNMVKNLESKVSTIIEDVLSQKINDICNKLQTNIENIVTETIYSKVSEIKGESYSDMVKIGKTTDLTKNNKPAPTLIIRPTKGQKPDKIREDIRSKINPTELQIGIRNLRDTRNGDVILKCSSDHEIEILKNAAERRLGDAYTISVPTKQNPRLKLIGYSGDQEERGIENSLKKQNQWITQDDEFKVVYIKKSKNKAPFVIFMECSPKFFNKAMIAGKLNLEWGRYPVYEDLNLSRCYKCQGYRHKSQQCKKGEVCGNCAEEHRTSSCQNNIKKCNNCALANKYIGTNYKIDHSTMDPNCPSTLYHINVLRSKIKYEN